MKLTVLVLMSISVVRAAEPARPKITGVAHIGFYAKDFDASAKYYRDLLGFEQAYVLDAARVFKINDRQFVELYPEREPNTDRLHHIALETEDAEKMRRYLAARGITVPERVGKDAFGNRTFDVQDPVGHTVRFVEYVKGGRLMRDRGKHLGPSRIAQRMMHVGVIVTKLEPELKFYTAVLGFREFWRGSSTGETLSWINLRAPDGDEYVELMLYKDAPAPTNRGNAHHLCLEVPDVRASAANLEARPYRKQYTRKIEPRVGRNNRWQVNLFDPDGSRAELMEPNTVNGVPAVSSKAPPPGS